MKMTKKLISLRVDELTLKSIKVLAQKQTRNMSNMIGVALKRYLRMRKNIVHELDAEPGSHLPLVLDEAISIARNSADLVKVKFNETTIFVNESSDINLLMRDFVYARMVKWPCIGPHSLSSYPEWATENFKLLQS